MAIVLGKDVLEEYNNMVIEQVKLMASKWPLVYVGVDPGASGGLVCIATDEDNLDRRVISAISMPGTEVDILNWMYDAMLLSDITPFGFIERVGGYIGDSQPGSSAFNFGLNYGYLRMALSAANIQYEDVTPRRWQRAMGIAPRHTKKKDGWEETKVAFKTRLKQHAQQLYPGEHITLSTADAFLLAEYCRRVRTGTLR